MNVLLVSATLLEVAPLLIRCNAIDDNFRIRVPPGTKISFTTVDPQHQISCLITGVGQALTAFHVGRELSTGEWNLAVQAGIAGAFTTAIKKCDVVRVESDAFGDLGAENNGGFLDVGEMGLFATDEFPFCEGRLIGSCPDMPSQFSSLKAVGSVTVNRVLSESHSIAWIQDKFSPDVVSMEGAAFFYASLVTAVPAVQVRSISDYVGPRDKAKWEIDGAISSLNRVLYEWLRGCR